MLTHVTFTGFDERTDLVELRGFLADHAPRSIEVAVLLSTSKAGEDRYPTAVIAGRILDTARKCGQRTAIHYCGGLARLAVTNFNGDHNELQRVYLALHSHAERLQLNLAAPRGVDLDGARSQASRLAHQLGRQIILQHRDPAGWPAPHPGVAYLFDQSGGRGVEPACWPELPTRSLYVGYAGGLNPDNVGSVVREVVTAHRARNAMRYSNSEALSQPFWIDMESGIREAFPGEPPSGDWSRPTYVSITRCRRVMEAVAPYLEARR